MTDDYASTALQALQDLIDSGGWRRLPGSTDAVVCTHPWDNGSVDTLVMHSDTEALIIRTNVIGKPVWRVEGTVVEVIAALRELPAPGQPGAPWQPLDAPNRDRDLGTP